MRADTYVRKQWEPPYMQPHRLGEINKFGNRGLREDVTDSVFGVAVDDLVRRFGSPLFVTSEERLRSNIRLIKKAFSTRYGKVIHGWSYKTNYLSAVCNILHQEGSYAEVVSRFEYEKARHLGVPADRIIFNGPNKQRPILERAITEGARIHVDHLDELKLIETIARERNIVVPLSLRLNFDTGYTELWSRFGFNIESGQAHYAARLIALSQHLRLTGLHSHIGTFVLEPRAYAEQVRIMCKFMREIESSQDVEIDSLDLGGGFPSVNALQRIYLPPEQVVPDINEYADVICKALLEETQYRLQTGRQRPSLIIESGRCVVDDAQVLIATVVGTKRLHNGTRAAILDAGTNVLFTGYWYNHDVKPSRPLIGAPEETVLYGPLCMNIDVMRHTIQLPPLSPGDHLVFSPVGAYNNTQWMQFIEYRPSVVLVDCFDRVSIIRKGEDLDVMTGQDVLPDHLVEPFPEDRITMPRVLRLRKADDDAPGRSGGSA
ncbi:MAG: alanine racemase [Cyanobacteria bacterium HKST-UBA02]|nr:alanine racemase [Cyanobacteria bacterium HKST-UBA02]